MVIEWLLIRDFFIETNFFFQIADAVIIRYTHARTHTHTHTHTHRASDSIQRPEKQILLSILTSILELKNFLKKCMP
jgi:hypothetical protein